MQYRPFGKTAIKVSETGFGAWQIGGAMWKDASDKQSFAALNRAVDLGVNFIDTAIAYQRSEPIVGRVVRSRSETIYVSSKIPPKNRKWPALHDMTLDETYPPDYVRQQAEASLKNLGLDHVDVMHFHTWTDEWTDDERWKRTVDDLKREGLFRYFAISLNAREANNGLKAVRTGLVDAVQVVYNIFEQAPEDKLFPLCREKGVAVIARVPFDEGGLTGRITPDTTFPEGDFRNIYFTPEVKAETYNRVEALREILPQEMTISQMALRFILSNPAVSTVIPGMTKIPHIEANVATSDGKGLPDDLIEALRAHRWNRPIQTF